MADVERALMTGLGLKAEHFEKHGEFLTYLIKGLCLVGLLFLVARIETGLPPVAFGIVVAALSAISSIAVAYHWVVRKTHKQLMYMEGGRLARFNEGRKLCLLVSFVVSVPAVFLLMVELPKWGAVQWILALCAVGVFYLVLVAAKKFVKKELEPPFRHSKEVAITIALVGSMALLAYAAAIAFEPMQEFSSIESAFNATANPYEASPTILLAEIGEFDSFSEGLVAYGLSETAGFSFEWYLVLRAFLAASSLLGFANLLGACSIPFGELKRVFLPLEFVKNPQSHNRPVWTHVAFACLLPLVCLVGLVVGNNAVEEMERPREVSFAKEFVREQVQLASYVIDGKFYDQKTTEDLLREVEDRAARLYDEASQNLVPLINEAFDRRVENVDSYLDWYYSLPADYERLIQFFVGSIEDGLREQLQSRINEGVDEEKLNQEMERFFSEANSIKEDLRQGLAACELHGVPDWLIGQKEELAPEVFSDILEPNERALAYKERLAAGVAAGVTGGFVSRAVVNKILARPVFQQMAAKLISALGTRGTVQLVTSAGGTAIAPGIGTAVGAIGGLVIGAAVDYVFLKVDEAQNREGYKSDIVAAIEEERTETLALFQTE